VVRAQADINETELYQNAMNLYESNTVDRQFTFGDILNVLKQVGNNEKLAKAVLDAKAKDNKK